MDTRANFSPLTGHKGANKLTRLLFQHRQATREARRRLRAYDSHTAAKGLFSLTKPYVR